MGRSLLSVACVAACLAALLGASASASAQDEGGARHVEAPPALDRHEPALLIEVHIGGIIPIERADICPGDSLCVLDAGGTVGVEIERRWPFGLGVSVGYDAWFVDSGGVFELGTVQIVRAALRYAFAYDWMIHPTIHLGAGALVFGDTFLVSTVGGAVEAGAGVEIELSETVALTAGLRGWLFTTTPFTTGRDMTLRSESLGLNAALQINVGLVVLAESAGP